MYNEEEKDYNYETGKSKTIFSHVDHFARIVWKNLTEVGCGQSLPNNLGCVFTVVLYHLDEKKEMSSEENYVKNIGIPSKYCFFSVLFETQVELLLFFFYKEVRRSASFLSNSCRPQIIIMKRYRQLQNSLDSLVYCYCLIVFYIIQSFI